jgi:hypothetical protein
MKFLFWFSLFMIFYAYFGYAMALLAIDTYRRIFRREAYLKNSRTIREPQSDDELPLVSFIITAYNEETCIGQKIENSLSISYPKEKLEIIVASDCSSDKTDDIVRGYEPQGVRLVCAPERKGKENAQMHGVQAAIGAVLVFSDVATILKPEAIRQIVSNFKDPSIGCVSSEDRFIDRDGRISGEGLYVRYEMFLRALESRVNTLVGLSGSFFAARRDVCHHWAPDLQSDFNTLLNSVKIGLKGISDPHSIGYYENIADESKEFQRKVRTVLRGITVLMRNLHLLNPSRQGMFAWQLFSHKLCRWLVPLFLMTALLSNLALVGSTPIYVFLFILQITFYGGAAFHFVQSKKPIAEVTTQRPGVTAIKKAIHQADRIAYYFVSVNASVLLAWLKFFSGERATFWQPSRR